MSILLHIRVCSAFCFQCGGGAMAGIDLIIPGQSRQFFQGLDDIVPVARRQVCSAAGALEQGIPAEDGILADIADGAFCVAGGFQYFKLHIAHLYYIAVFHLHIGMYDDIAAAEMGAVDAGVCENTHFLGTANDGTAVMLRYFIHRACVVVMTMGQQDMGHLQVVFFDISIQGGRVAVAVDDSGDAVVIGNHIVVRTDGASRIASNLHGGSSLFVRISFFSNYINPAGNLQQEWGRGMKKQRGRFPFFAFMV